MPHGAGQPGQLGLGGEAAQVAAVGVVVAAGAVLVEVDPPTPLGSRTTAGTFETGTPPGPVAGADEGPRAGQRGGGGVLDVLGGLVLREVVVGAARP